MVPFSAKNWVDGILQTGEVTAMPIITYAGLHFTGKSVRDLVTNGHHQAKCIEWLAEKFPSLAGVMVMDLSVEAEVFGAPVQFYEHEVPGITKALLNDATEIASLEIPPVRSGRTAAFIEAASLAAKAVAGKPVFGGMIGPFSLAARLMDISEMMTCILTDPEAAHQLLEKTTAFLVRYAKAYKDQAVQGLIIAEPAAGLLSPEWCDAFSSRYIQQIISAVQDDQFIVILHNCGNTVNLVSSMVATGARGLHFGNAVDMSEILPQVPKHTLAFGNLDPAGIFKMGDAKLVASKTIELIETGKNYENFVLSSGCDVPPGTTLQNIETFYNTIHQYNHRKK